MNVKTMSLMKAKESLLKAAGFLAASFLAVSSLHAETATVESQNVAPLQRIFPNSYGGFSLLHIMEKGKFDSENKPIPGRPVQVQARYELGSKFFNGSMDSAFVFGLVKRPNNDVVEDRGTRWNTYWTAFSYDNGLLKFVPYAEVSVPNKGLGTSAKFGAWVPLAYKPSTSLGVVTVGVEYDAHTYMGSRPNGKVPVEGEIPDDRRQALALKAQSSTDRPLQVYQNSPTLEHEFHTVLGFEPNSVRGLELELRHIHEHKYVPAMVYDSTRDAVVSKSSDTLLMKQAYNSASEDTLRTTVSYSVNKTVKICNELNLSNKFYDGTRYFMNRIILEADLF
ncbi:MAG: hypothetical protein KA436_05580 [Oligoflexales bacterium]|nr:hypothetical protein [Oligoflexales bacterium]